MAAGAAALGIYAVVEVWACDLVPSALGWVDTYQARENPLVLLFLLLVYLAVGALLGFTTAAVAAAFHPADRGFERSDFPGTTLVTILLLLLFAMNLLAQYQFRLWILLLSGLCLAWVVLLCVRILIRRENFLSTLPTNAWLIWVVVLGSASVLFYQRESGERLLKTAGLLSFLGAVAAITHAMRNWRLQPAVNEMGLVVALAGTWCLSAFGDRLNQPWFPAFSDTPSRGWGTPVILITLDSVRADHLSIYGYERGTTPNLQLLLNQATLYRHALATSNYTLPTHASLFTGLYPTRHGAHPSQQNPPRHRPLDRRFSTLAERLRSKGYLTLAVVANNVFLDPRWGLHRGFDYYDCHGKSVAWQATRPRQWTLRTHLWNQEVLEWFKRRLDPRGSRYRFRSAESIKRQAVNLLERLGNRGKPFLLFLNFMDAHHPYVPPAPYGTMYSGRDRAFSWDEYTTLTEKSLSEVGLRVADRTRAHLISQYDGALSYLDAQLGELLDYFKSQPWYDQCLLIVTSDHGEAFGRKGMLGHGATLYQAQIGIPMIIKYPHQQGPAVIDTPISQVDVKPTVLDLIGVPLPSGMDGVSLAGARTPSRSLAIAESYPLPSVVALNRKLSRIERTIVSGPFKLITSTVGRSELYDVSIDPLEQNDLFGRVHVVSKELERRLSHWLDQSVAPAGLGEVDGEDLERLRALGY